MVLTGICLTILYDECIVIYYLYSCNVEGGPLIYYLFSYNVDCGPHSDYEAERCFKAFERYLCAPGITVLK